MTPPATEPDPSCTDLSLAGIRRALAARPIFARGKTLSAKVVTRNDYYVGLASVIRDLLLHRALCTWQTYYEKDARVVAYLSAEFLLGPHLGQNLLNLGILGETRVALSDYGLDLESLLEQEEEPGLGNGGLGRLAACFLESLATLQVPAVGYGLHYEFGIFDQAIRDGWQVELTDKWLRFGNPWELVRPELTYHVKLGGHTEAHLDASRKYRVRWAPERVVRGVAHDTPILGYRVQNCNFLRLWKAEACESFDFDAFNQGDYYGAVEEKVASENITKVLYPNDEPLQGKRLRLEQQYFLVSCSLQDMVRLQLLRGKPIERFHESWAVQLNDTHPALGVPELMRILIDDLDVPWDTAWDVVRSTFAYTNHTLLPEALERWSLALFRSVLPRHLEIVYEINRRFLDDVRKRCSGDEGRVARLSIIEEGGGKQVRMANLACVGSFAVNGVSALHTELLKAGVLGDFFQLDPAKFSNKTNGVTPRRFVALSNPGLAALVTSRIGDAWVRDLQGEIPKLEPLAEDAAFREEWRRVKVENKRRLAKLLAARAGVAADPESLFDVQVKRIHEYKRQHLNVLHIVTLYNRIKAEPSIDVVPRTFILGGKAAPGYHAAKLIIRLYNGVAEVVNSDPDVRGRIRVAFFPDFNVKNAQKIYPAADLSEQISTAGKEASGTGNMKFAMNGALTIGTLDGANVEIRDAVGPENFFLFGLTAAEVTSTRDRGYSPRAIYETNPELRAAIDLIASGRFSRGDGGLFRPIVDSLLGWDPYMLLADYASYVECQDRVAETFRDRKRWTRMSILNVARVGRFSSDRTMREYCEEIWRVTPVPVEGR